MAALDPQLGHIAPTKALLAASRHNAVSDIRLLGVLLWLVLLEGHYVVNQLHLVGTQLRYREVPLQLAM